MKLFLLIAGASLVFAAGASANTENQAIQKARACLVSHGATVVRAQSPYDGAYAMVGGKQMTWYYSPRPSAKQIVRADFPVTGIRGVNFFGHKWTERQRAQVNLCLRQSVN